MDEQKLITIELRIVWEKKLEGLGRVLAGHKSSGLVALITTTRTWVKTRQTLEPDFRSSDRFLQMNSGLVAKQFQFHCHHETREQSYTIREGRTSSRLGQTFLRGSKNCMHANKYESILQNAVIRQKMLIGNMQMLMLTHFYHDQCLPTPQ